MEFLLGSMATVLAIWILRTAVIKDLAENSNIFIKYSQSHIHQITKELIPNHFFLKKQGNTQSKSHEKSMYTRVVFVDNEAYWIKNNALFVADMEEGIVAEETARIVDTMGLDKVQLEKVIHIVEALTEGRKDDGGYSGYENL
jgi:hypothetical protein